MVDSFLSSGVNMFDEMFCAECGVGDDCWLFALRATHKVM